MTDIVERLRLLESGARWMCNETADTLEDAADEIERLRAEREEAIDQRSAADFVLASALKMSERRSVERDAARVEAARLRASLGEMVTTFHDAGCHVCGGDCASANPPVGGCPIGVIQRARAALAAKEPGHE